MKIWYKVIVNTPSIASEITSDILREYGSEGIETKTHKDSDLITLISYHQKISSRKDLEGSLKKAYSFFPDDKRYTPVVDIIPFEEKDWVKIQGESIKAFNISERVTIVPPSRIDKNKSTDPNHINVILKPGQAFGTGEHPTTRQCIVALEKYVKPGDRIIDVGAGSAILSIVALKLGASEALAVEIDSKAVDNGVENIDLNDLSDKVSWHIGTVRTLRGEGKYEIIAANILSQVIIRDIGYIKKIGSKDSKYIFSGIISFAAQEFLLKMAKSKFVLLEEFPEGEWRTFVMEYKK
jgi:ribosomal protein L11 methyltransferase